MSEPEPVFGDIKNNRGFKRFLLRGLPKVSLEVGWLSLANNLLKKAAIDAKIKELSTYKPLSSFIHSTIHLFCHTILSHRF
nr:transposase [Paenibacillus elgii]